MAEEQKTGIVETKTVLSGIKPTGELTLGNYIGALKNWIGLQGQYRCFYAVADLHAITIDIVPSELRNRSLDLYAMFIALGLDPEKCVLFVQSHVPAHAELTWVLNCFTQFGEAKRMTQFKDKSQKNPQNINVGLFDYPVLQASDILLYQAHYVPIGKDQQQHLELSRVIAERFNNRYSPTFVVPEGIYPKFGAKVFSLSDPAAKMGKSEEDAGGCVFLTDDADTVRRKFKRAVTDSDTFIKYDPAKKPGVSNLLTIYASMAGVTVKAAESEFAGKNYVDLKEKTAEAVIETLRPKIEAFKKLRADKNYLAALMKSGAEKAAETARKTLAKVYKKIGFIDPRG
ncbi:MAG: tryptophan--tRNA ligase [Firmicutes bacterium]|nr:tryptophan--tRNA ligase [Bacillota bacterium]